eukprot:CAMPEP_0176295844 /NCGR_PEP_ID=MMETSP0121_2-20121125/57880_1 /TAXON_ID=160619 /ORGANISM="Kryptoperidinium foliaceum, Strain CCMP 1326" /LENGTH=75 /DNA_ID=CAMNT_0017636943 /DNA_START=26 /DNA_END=250 /DNA_ORIENTATION=-
MVSSLSVAQAAAPIRAAAFEFTVAQTLRGHLDLPHVITKTLPRSPAKTLADEFCVQRGVSEGTRHPPDRHLAELR